MKCEKCGFGANPKTAVSCRLCGKPLAAAKEALPRGRRGASLRHETEWKRHVLLRVGAPHLELTKGERVTLGRAAECDLPIPSQRVSRQHAEITWDGDVALLSDLGSENGTQVDGRSIREHRLQDRQEITVGPYTCTYRCVSGRGSLDELLEVTDTKAGTARYAAPLRGQVDENSLFEVLGALEFNTKTGTFILHGTGHDDGTIVLDAGVPTYAALGDMTGERAVFAILSHESGEFRFEPDVDASLAPNLEDTTVTRLLLTARERMDSRHTMPHRLADLGDLDDEDGYA